MNSINELASLEVLFQILRSDLTQLNDYVKSTLPLYKSSKLESMEDLAIYHHSVEKWVENHSHEVPECFRSWFRRFIIYCRRTGVKDIALYTYLPKVRDFLKFLHENGVNDVKDVDEDVVAEFLEHLRVRGFKESTIHNYAKTVKKFLKMLVEKGVISEKVYKSLKLKSVEYLPPVIRPELIKLINEFIEKLPIKYRVIYHILRETGARIGEILRIKLQDVKEFESVNGVKGFEIVLRKSKSKPRAVFIIQYYHILKSWIDNHPGRNNPNTYLIFGREPSRPLTRSSINNVVQNLAKKLGYDKEFTKLISKVYINPHLLRHVRAYEYAHLIHHHKLSEKEVRQLLGWKTPRMIDVYIELMPEDLKRAYLRTLGIEAEDMYGQEAMQEPVKCSRCGFENLPGSKYCSRCGYPLTIESVVEVIRSEEDRKRRILTLLRELAKLVDESGLSVKDLLSLL